ncbi:hypothetical protein PoB_000825600 [Plakobranchus ocellatus]|uniref:Uncharacterized protein n=1 Tax=Plakobranchus ocellatus TaxID=259542 RepID=A0AAV3YEY0_9GAST|nr:hypothetical protein PoB_000825600 [Plakobranchus ocellatus]
MISGFKTPVTTDLRAGLPTIDSGNASNTNDYIQVNFNVTLGLHMIGGLRLSGQGWVRSELELAPESSLHFFGRIHERMGHS